MAAQPGTAIMEASVGPKVTVYAFQSVLVTVPSLNLAISEPSPSCGLLSMYSNPESEA
jgi:hypothetical protein